ncbi:MAG: beta-lactamase family protein, partial [Mucilaginibacter polytrichastri]|nr:beta-lactamase family protein [Mucilaginibacter polytrichastri]
MSRFVYLLLLLIFFLPHAGQAQNQKAEAEIDSIMKSMKTVGLAAVVVKDGKIIYEHAFGYKNLETKTPLQNDNLFRIASISKSFSATSVMQLVDQQKLSLDDDVSKLVGFKIRNPKFPETPITLKMLLSHRSSLNDSQGYFSLDYINPATNPNWAKCYNNYKPGSDYQYCNLNFNLVGTIIEKTSGERFDQYVKHHVLDPLKLYGGYCVDSLDKNRFATLYEYNAKADSFAAAANAYAPRSEE